MPSNRFPIPYSGFLKHNFQYLSHSCNSNCVCRGLGCAKHYVYVDSSTGYDEEMRSMLATWQAFRTPSRNGVYLMNEWQKYFKVIASNVKPFSNMTLFCDWDQNGLSIAKLFDTTKATFFDSVVCTTKTLHCLVPDLFLILDRQQVFGPWKNYVNNRQIIPGSFSNVTGKNYEQFLKLVRGKIGSSIANSAPFLMQNQTINCSTLDQLRYINPIRPNGLPPDLPNTLGKVLDNIMGNRPYEE